MRRTYVNCASSSSCNDVCTIYNSKLAGVVADADGNPLVGANVVVEGSNLGAATDELGRYYILDVPVGTYDQEQSTLVTPLLLSQALELLLDLQQQLILILRLQQ